MASSNNNLTAVHFSLMFFVMLSLILGVMAWLNFKDLDEAITAAATADQKAKNLEKQVRDKDDQIQWLKKQIGHELADVGTEDDPNTNTVLGVMLQDMNVYGGELAQATYTATIRKLREELDNLTVQRNALQVDLTSTRNDITRETDRHNSEIAKFQQATQVAEQERDKATKDKDEQLAKRQADIVALQQQVTTVQLELEQTREEHANTLKALNDRLGNLKTINAVLQSKIDKEQQLSFEIPDGEVRWVDHTTGLVWINLGEDDKLPKRLNFSVYSKGHHGVGRGEEDIKGAIEVTRIIDKNLAEARVLDERSDRPIAPGDPIYTPLWSPGRTEAFAFVGLIDLDDDGRSDRELLHDILSASGATITTEIDDNGERIGGPIDVHTKFLVIGDIPDPTKSTRPTEQEIFKNIGSQHKKLVEEAREQGVRVISLKAFKDYIGYTPQRQLWVPGTQMPFKLKAGAHSTGVDQTSGNRESSGQVSGAITGKGKFGQPASKEFRGGGKSGY